MAAWKEKEKAKSLKLYEMAWYNAALPRQKRIPNLMGFMRNFMETTDTEMSEARAFHEEVLEMKRKKDGG